MAYVAPNYDSNSSAPLGKWVGIDHGVAYAGTKAVIFKPKDKDDKQPDDEGRPGTYYGECVSYVKAVTPGLINKVTGDWKQGVKVSPVSHPNAQPVHAGIKPTAQYSKAKLGLHFKPNPVDRLTEFSRSLTSMDSLKRGLQYFENEYHSLMNAAHTVILPGPAILPGTVIATFNEHGHYFGHAAIYEKQDDQGIYVVAQWISGIPAPIHRYRLRFNGGSKSTGSRSAFVGDGDNYYVVE